MTDKATIRQRQHCWHNKEFGSEWTDGSAGWDQVQCCHCGGVARRQWHREVLPDDPAHGSYQEKRYRRVAMELVEDCPGEGAKDD